MSIKIAIIGIGSIAMQLIHLLLKDMQKNAKSFVNEIIAIGKNNKKLKAQCFDQLHTFLLDDLHSNNKNRIVEKIYKRIAFTTDYKYLSGSDYIVTCFSVPLNQGHKSRNEFLEANARIAKNIAKKIRCYAKHNSVLINVTNPLDIITWYLQELINFPHHRVLGVSGTLDSVRFLHNVHNILGVPFGTIKINSDSICGEHGETMVPMFSNTTINGTSLVSLINAKQRAKIKKHTVHAGLKMVNQLGNKSPHFGPAQAVYNILKALEDKRTHFFSCCAWNNEYGVYMATPIKISSNGTFKVLPINGNASEIKQLKLSATRIKKLKLSVNNSL